VNPDGTQSLYFTSCTPAGAPAAPTCGTPALITQVAHPLSGMANIDLLAFTYPKHVNRLETNGKFTTFLAYDDCKNAFRFGNPPTTTCLDAEVLLMISSDGGNSWTTPASVDTSTGHHFYPAMALDASTGTVHLTYYSTSGDKFNHEVRVVRNEVASGGTQLGTSQLVTTVLDPIDGDPQQLGSFQLDLFMGAAARGTGVTGQSRLYLSFDSTTVAGTYEGRPNAEQNNHIGLVVY
jgi:hypothetical protein